MKKLFSALLLVTMIFTLFSCVVKIDSELIKKNKQMVIGITLYEPMNYKDDSGKLIGFDTEFAEAVCAKLGVKPEFQVINWDTKETELKAKNIDCIWNGLTVTEPRRENMDFTKSYLINKQCIVIKSADVAKYTTTESLKAAMIMAEKGSAGETAVKADANLNSAQYTAADSQAAALTALNAGNCDAVVIDYTLAKASAGKGDYSNMMIIESIALANEEYAIGFRVRSDLTAQVNAIIDTLISDGTLRAIAEKYDVLDLYLEAVE